MVIDEINEKWSQDQKYGVDKMFLIGGGGEYLFEEIKNSRELAFIKDRIELPADFRFINAKGYLVKAQEIEDIVLNQNVLNQNIIARFGHIKMSIEIQGFLGKFYKLSLYIASKIGLVFHMVPCTKGEL